MQILNTEQYLHNGHRVQRWILGQNPYTEPPLDKLGPGLYSEDTATKEDTMSEEPRDPYDVTYMVTVTILPEQDGHPGESEIRKAIYRGVEDVASEDCVYVERVG